MSLAIIDAREWQNIFNLRTGRKVETNGPVVDTVKKVLSRHPYPGDVDYYSNKWVSDTALDLIKGYNPGFVFLAYAQQYFAGRFSLMHEEDREEMIFSVFREVERFINESGFTPIIIGNGDLIDHLGNIDLTRLDGLALSTNWSARYSGLHGASDRDLAYIESSPFVERIVTRDEFIELFTGSPGDPYRLPDYLVVAKEGYSCRSAGTPLRKSHMVPGNAFEVPVATSLGEVKSILDIPQLIKEKINDEKIALILMEGIGMKNFRWLYTPCKNSVDWFYYEPSEAQYLAITTGEQQVFEYPIGYKYYEEDDETKEFPFSGYFRSISDRTIGNRMGCRSIAVGNRSMFMHMVTGADISVECFARNLFNQGCMAVIHREKTRLTQT